jgi:AhpD family alkylhydroperoxidase
MTHRFEQFREKRLEGNAKLVDTKNLGLKRFIGLDKTAFKDGALPGKTKELLGLVASMVLRCNDCIDYHLEQTVSVGFTKDEIDEALMISMLIGGSIVIPHARHAQESLEFLLEEQEAMQEQPPLLAEV